MLITLDRFVISKILKDVWNIQNLMHIVEIVHRFQGYLWQLLNSRYVLDTLGPTLPRCTVPVPLSLWRVRCKEIETRPMLSLQNTTRPHLGKWWKMRRKSLHFQWYASCSYLFLVSGTILFVVLFCLWWRSTLGPWLVWGGDMTCTWSAFIEIVGPVSDHVRYVRDAQKQTIILQTYINIPTYHTHRCVHMINMWWYVHM